MTASLTEPAPPTIDELLAQARSRLAVLSHRLSARAAYQALLRGALLLDIRPAAQRSVEGSVPGALVIDPEVIGWRLDPGSEWRLPQAAGHDAEVVVLCSQGSASAPAAAVLRGLGLHRATDIVGGFDAWRAAGLPVD